MSKTPAVPQTALEAAGAVVTPTSLTLDNPDLPWEKYVDLGAFVGEVNKACAWWGGDLVVFGEAVYGEQVANIDEVLGLAPQTIANRASVARHIPPSKRRPELAFGTHAEVAYLEPKERDRWLALAVKNGWKRSDLREAMRAERTQDPGSPVAVVTNSSGGEIEVVDALPAPVCPNCGKPL